MAEFLSNSELQQVLRILLCCPAPYNFVRVVDHHRLSITARRPSCPFDIAGGTEKFVPYLITESGDDTAF
jgi:hypothetical protein